MAKLITKPEPAWLVSAFVAGVLLAAAIFVPLWKMELVAPQYPSGLVMYAYGDRFEGETDGYYKGFDAVKEINALNHYIGMKPIERVTEMTLFIPGMLATVAGLIAVSFIAWHKKLFRGLMIAAVWFLPIFFVADLQYWLYNYGHSMDPRAALNTGDITPKVLGSTKVWNFHSENSLQIGFFLMVLSALTITFMPMAIRRAQAWRQQKTTNAGITADTSVGATAAHGETA
jgi:hypothetical protein